MTAPLDVDDLRAELRAAGRDWWVCRCGRKVVDHSMRTVPSTGGRELVCTLTGSGRLEPVTLPELDYTPQKGLHFGPKVKLELDEPLVVPAEWDGQVPVPFGVIPY